MPEQSVGVIDQTAAGSPNAVPVDVRQMTNANAGAVTNPVRQIVVIGDPDNLAQTLSLTDLARDRQMLELTLLRDTQTGLQGLINRGRERQALPDARGNLTGIGATR